MANQFDLLIKNAALRTGHEGPVDIGISGGIIQAVQGNLSGESGQVIDAEGNLVTESFINPHRICARSTRCK